MSLKQEIESRMVDSKRNMCVYYTFDAFLNAEPRNKIEQKIVKG